MFFIRHYLLSIIAAAVICAVVRAFAGKKGSTATIVNLISGIFLCITVISPWTDYSFSDITEHIGNYSNSAEAIVSDGVLAAQRESSTIIKKEAEAYIVNKAKSLGVDLQAEVTLNEHPPTTPKSVRLTANASPYLRNKISQDIFENLGIPEAEQIWN